ncbi:MAG: hypothetical protein IJN96_00235 [Clostridia bacterium]|nr:hypothetical protein [Clostridia bacterium]
MNKSVLGIDLGTSSVKVLKYSSDEPQVTSEKYDEISVDGWISALTRALGRLDLSDVVAIGLSSQVGTYVVNRKKIISWNDAEGSAELEEICPKYGKDLFMKEISMVHPKLISYPIPRLLSIKRKFGEVGEICQPKEKIMEFLTGNSFSDKYSWRGLCNMESGNYSDFFLGELGIERKVLPKLKNIFSECGRIREEVAEKTGLRKGTPVFNGLNDFYASLLGMGILEENQVFDITGTSEHMGVIKSNVDSETMLVSSEYFGKSVNYGVTAASGPSLDFGMKNFGFEDLDWVLCRNAPIFTPYLRGERAPVFDADASGTFFGIKADTTKQELAYSVLEGVAFSIYHIYELLMDEKCGGVTVSGGASKNLLLNSIKATLFDSEVSTLKIADTSALGACVVAAVGNGMYGSVKRVVSDMVKKDCTYKPNPNRELLLKRFEIYKEIYPALKDKYKRLKETEK